MQGSLGEPQEHGGYGEGIIHCDGRDSGGRWWKPEVTIISNGMLTRRKVKSPTGWFTFNGFKHITRIHELVARATVIWCAVEDDLRKNEVKMFVTNVCDAIRDICCSSVVFFVTHVPLCGEHQRRVVKFNNNLMYFLRQNCRMSGRPATQTIAVHHWCLKQGKRWRGVEDIHAVEQQMLIEMVTGQVRAVLGLGSDVTTCKYVM